MPAWNPFPVAGPSLYTIRGFSGATIAAGASLGPPGSGASVIQPLCQWLFPRDLFVTGILVTPRGAAAESDLAKLALRIQDESFQDMISTGWQNDHFANCGALMRQPSSLSAVTRLHPFRLQRPVRSHDEWLITLRNDGAAPIDVASVTLYFDEPRPGLYGAGVNA